MKKLSVAIVDDDFLFQTIIKGFVKKTDALELVETFSDPIEALNYLNNQPVDLIFLDVEMPDMSGLQFIKALSFSPQIVLITSSELHAVSAFEHQVTDYLLKPLNDYSRFLKAVDLASESFNKQVSKDSFFVKVDNKLTKVKFCEINYVEAFGDYVKIHLKDKFLVTFSSLKLILEKLPLNDFLKTHRSYVVRIDSIDSIEGNFIQINDIQLPVSKSLKEEVLNRIIH